jgi:signal transduction histidine kinase
MSSEVTTDDVMPRIQGDADIQRLREDLPTLEAIERRRGQLWIVASLLMLAASLAVFLLIVTPDAAEAVPDSLGIRLGFAGASIAFLLYVFDQERRLRRLADALVRERVLSAALTARVRDMSTLSRVGQVVNAVLSMREVLEVVLEGAFELTGASRGSVMLLEDSELSVSVSAGDNPAPVGSRQAMGEGVAGWVATHREPLLITGDLQEDQLPGLRSHPSTGGSSVCAPMVLGDELVGVLALERTDDGQAFTEWDMRAVTLFASHAATAVSNSRRYEQERENVERLTQLVESRSESVATMVHDLKGPLASVIGFAQLLRQRDDMEPEMRSDFAARIEQGGKRLLGMIDGVLEGASNDARLDIRRDPVDVQGLVYELADLTVTMAQGRDGMVRPVVVTCDVDEAMLRVDEAALRSILVNLLENAVKYSPPESVIEVGLYRSDRELRITVRDEGQGIPPDEVDSVFDRFRRRSSQGTAHAGVGLGLYIVRSLAQAYGGRIDVRSTLGRGTTFTVAFPDHLLAREGDEDLLADAAPVRAPSPPDDAFPASTPAAPAGNSPGNAVGNSSGADAASPSVGNVAEAASTRNGSGTSAG